MSFRSKYIGQFSKAKLGWFCWWGYRAVRDGQLSEACLTNPCGYDLPGGAVELADGHQTPAQQVQGGARTINSVPEVKWEPSAPEVKRLTLSQRLNGKNGHQSCLPVRVFAIFCDVSRCHAICIFLTRGGLPYERGGDAHRKFWIKPLKKTNLGVGQPFLTPKGDHFLTMFFRYWCYRKHNVSARSVSVTFIVFLFSPRFQLFSCYSRRP